MAEKGDIVNIVNMHGTTMLSCKKVFMKDDDVVMDGAVMGSMPGTFYVKPIELYKMVQMVDFSTVFAILKSLRKGKKEYKASLLEK